MDAASLRKLYDHHAWALDRLLARALNVTAEEAAKQWGTTGSLVDIFDHIVTAESLWLGRWLGRRRARWAGAGSVVEVQERWRALQAETRAFLAGLEAAHLDRGIPRRDPSRSWPLAAGIMHVLLHGAQHRAEAAELLSQAGYSPGELDYLDFLGEHEALLRTHA